MEIPYTVEPRPDTGVNNVTMGIWLFLASEVMLFGGLFSAYVQLRRGSPGWDGVDLLHRSWAAGNTVVLVAAGAAVAVAAARLKAGRPGARAGLALAALGALVFLGVKGAEYAALAAAGYGPASSSFLAVYYLLTGVHAAHVAGALVVAGHFAGLGFRMSRTEPLRFAHRVGALVRYWYFVDAMWLIVFWAMYW